MFWCFGVFVFLLFFLLFLLLFLTILVVCFFCGFTRRGCAWWCWRSLVLVGVAHRTHALIIFFSFHFLTERRVSDYQVTTLRTVRQSFWTVLDFLAAECVCVCFFE